MCSLSLPICYLPYYSLRGILCIKGVKNVLKRYNVTLSEDTVKRVQDYADKRHISFSAAIRCIVIDAIDFGLFPAVKPDDEDSQQ